MASPLSQAVASSDLGGAFTAYVAELRSAWDADEVLERAAQCTAAMERLLRSSDPHWLAAMELLASEPESVELYRDSGCGFVVRAHSYAPDHATAPHGHGEEGWVVYGVQRGEVEIGIYEPLPNDEDRLRRVGAECLTQGTARAYLPGQLHSTRTISTSAAERKGTIVLRWLSEDMSQLERRRYAWDDVEAGSE